MQGTPNPQMGPQAQDELMRVMLQRLKMNPRYEALAEAVEKAPSVKLRTTAGDENILFGEREATGLYSPGAMEAKIALMPSGTKNRTAEHEAAVAHELSHHLVRSETPQYSGSRMDERIAQAIESGMPARAEYKPGRPFDETLRDARNIDGILKMILQAHKYRK